jgi:hypothetical protein
VHFSTLAEASGPHRRESPHYRPSSIHGVVGSDGTRRCMTRGRSTVINLTSAAMAPASAPAAAANVRRGFNLRASAASLALIDRAPAVPEPEDVDEPFAQRDGDHASSATPTMTSVRMIATSIGDRGPDSAAPLCTNRHHKLVAMSCLFNFDQLFTFAGACKFR